MSEHRLRIEEEREPVPGRGAGSVGGGTTRDNLVRAALRLAAEQGIDGVSVRSIARAAGVTEGALYKHFSSKDALWRDAYGAIVAEMIEEKQRLLGERMSTRERIAAWVRLTYAYYDGNKDAFTYVLLLPHPFAEELGEEYHAQGRLFEELIERGRGAGEVDTSMGVGLARSLFVGMLLSVPAQINEGGLKGPALEYADEVTAGAWRVLGVR
ncbi:MAG: TetR/AcrR family transcriptional regulator [Phycisphaerales bacterium JB065]